MNLDRFLEIEKKFDLYHKSLNNCDYWEYFRFDICRGIVSRKQGIKPEKRTNDGGKKNGKIYGVLNQYINYLKDGRIKKKHYDILFLANGRRVLEGDIYELPIIDMVANMYENSIVLERLYYGRKMRPAGTKNLKVNYYIYSPFQIIMYKLRQQLYLKKFITHIKEELKEPLAEIQEAYDLKDPIEIPWEDIAKRCIRYPYDRKNYIKQIDKITPKLIIEECYYDEEKMVYNEIAKEKGIPVIELQHGTAGREHPGYNYAEGVVVRQFPDYFYAFSKFWCQWTRYPLPAERVISTGSPYKERKAMDCQINSDKIGQRIILFLSEANNTREISKVAIRLSELLDSDKYRIIYKMHPTEYSCWRDNCPELLDSGIEVVDTPKPGLYELFARASFQISSINSTTVYEGFLFKLKTFINLNYAMDEYRMLCDMGYAKGFYSVEELRNLIVNGYEPEKQVFLDDIWEPGALNNIKREIDRLL